jgi:predicted DNA-binding transcriptional regulator YafY
MQRNQQVSRLFSIVRDLSLAPLGVSLSDLAAKYGVSRRTVERDLEAVSAFGYEVETMTDADSSRLRKRIANGGSKVEIRLAAAELAATRAAERALSRVAAGPIAATFRLVAERLEQAQPTAVRVDAASLDTAQTIVTWPAPQPSADATIVANLQDAILRGAMLHVTYRKGGKDSPKIYLAAPCGILLGGRNYLVWRGEDGSYRKFVLAHIDAVQPTGAFFAADPAFSLDEFVGSSVGVLSGPELDVVLSVVPEGVARLQDFSFHASQRLEMQTDGSAVVRFRAAGAEAICTEVFAWGGLARIDAPAALKVAYRQRLEDALLSDQILCSESA